MYCIQCACNCIIIAAVIAHAEHIPQVTERHFLSHSAKEISAKLKNLKPENCTNDRGHCSDSANDKFHYKMFPHVSRGQRVSATQSLLEGSTRIITSYLEMRKYKVCENQVLWLQKAVGYFQNAEIKFNSLVLLGRLQSRSAMASVYKFLCSATVEETLNNIQIMEEVSTENRRVVSLVYFFHQNRPKVTNVTASACYSTLVFMQETFEIVYHVEAILKHIVLLNANHHSYRLNNIGLVINEIRDLKAKQLLHVHSVCKNDPSFVVATWNSESPCAKLISKSHHPCESQTIIRLFSDRNVLHVGCGFPDFHTDDCTDEERDSHHGVDWYMSTVFISLSDPFHHYICKVALGEHFFPAYNHHLLYLNVTVCFTNNASITSFATSYTTDLRKHHIIHYPIIFNQGTVAASHPIPFYISGIGLYIDELERLALNISTFKPVTDFRCSSKSPLLVGSHTDVPLPVV